MMIAAGLIVVALGTYLIVGSLDRKVPNEVDAQSIKQLVQEYSSSNMEDKSASITSQQLIVTDENANKLTYELPEDEFFVSIAPFVEETHPCAIHSLTGCQGEMVEQEFNVYINDKKGNVVLDQKLKSQSNGFIDLWLPRDTEYEIKIEHDGRTAQSQFSTFKKDNTCITTIQLM
jgi:hypothetical protein